MVDIRKAAYAFPKFERCIPVSAHCRNKPEFDYLVILRESGVASGSADARHTAAMPGATLLGKGSQTFVTRSRSGAVTPPPQSAFNVCPQLFFVRNRPPSTPLVRISFPCGDTQIAPKLFCTQIYFNRVYFNLGGSYERTAFLDSIVCGTAGL